MPNFIFGDFLKKLKPLKKDLTHPMALHNLLQNVYSSSISSSSKGIFSLYRSSILPEIPSIIITLILSVPLSSCDIDQKALSFLLPKFSIL